MKKQINNYIKYLQDNPEGYWFKRKLYGYGWTPATKEGWLVTGAFVAGVLFITFRLDESATDAEVLKLVVIPVFALVAFFLLITWRTGEKLKWMWGEESRGDSARPSEESSERSE